MIHTLCSPVPGDSGTRLRGPIWPSWNAVLTSWQLYANTSTTFTANKVAEKIHKYPQKFTRGHVPRDIAASHSRCPCDNLLWLDWKLRGGRLWSQGQWSSYDEATVRETSDKRFSSFYIIVWDESQQQQQPPQFEGVLLTRGRAVWVQPSHAQGLQWRLRESMLFPNHCPRPLPLCRFKMIDTADVHWWWKKAGVWLCN